MKDLSKKEAVVEKAASCMFLFSCARMCELKTCCKKYKRGKRCKKCPKK